MKNQNFELIFVYHYKRLVIFLNSNFQIILIFEQESGRKEANKHFYDFTIGVRQWGI